MTETTSGTFGKEVTNAVFIIKESEYLAMAQRIAHLEALLVAVRTQDQMLVLDKLPQEGVYHVDRKVTAGIISNLISALPLPDKRAEKIKAVVQAAAMFTNFSTENAADRLRETVRDLEAWE